MYWLYNLVYISNPPILFVYHMHVVKQVVQQSSGSGCSVFIGFGQNRNPKKSGIRPELTDQNWVSVHPYNKLGTSSANTA